MKSNSGELPSKLSISLDPGGIKPLPPPQLSVNTKHGWRWGVCRFPLISDRTWCLCCGLARGRLEDPDSVGLANKRGNSALFCIQTTHLSFHYFLLRLKQMWVMMLIRAKVKSRCVCGQWFRSWFSVITPPACNLDIRSTECVYTTVTRPCLKGTHTVTVTDTQGNMEV